MPSLTSKPLTLTTISGGINRLRTKGGADKNSLWDLLNGYVTQANTVKVRPGTFRQANIAATAGAGTTKGLTAYQGDFHVFSNAVVTLPTGYQLHILNNPANSADTISEINFCAPYLGGLYVVATFASGVTYHYWVQSSTASDTSNVWTKNTDYAINTVVIPSTPNGFTYVAQRLKPPNPLWTANTPKSVGNIVEPNTANGYYYTATATEGANPSTGTTEPTWPTSDGATVVENSTQANDQSITLATSAVEPTPQAPTRYLGLINTGTGVAANLGPREGL